MLQDIDTYIDLTVGIILKRSENETIGKLS
jgi:hypothetical protein